MSVSASFSLFCTSFPDLWVLVLEALNSRINEFSDQEEVVVFFWFYF